MSTYIAWDGKEYPLTVPAGWYFGTDDRWWPEGHGPGPAPAARPPESAGAAGRLPSAAPPVDRTIYSSPPPGSGSGPASPLDPTVSSGDGGRRGKRVLAAALIAVPLVALIAITFVRAGDDDAADVAESTTSTTSGTVREIAPETAPSDAEQAPTTTAPSGKGSLANPFVIGEAMTASYADVETGELRTWNIEVTGPPSDITDAVLEENQFNDPPEGDRRFIGVPLRITYVSGPVPASLFELTFKAVGPSAVVMTTFDPSCGVIPDGLDTLTQVFEGGVVEGNVCWSARPSDVDDLTMLIEVFLEDTEIYVDLAG